MKAAHYLNLTALIRPNRPTRSQGWILGKLIIESAVLAILGYCILVMVML